MKRNIFMMAAIALLAMACTKEQQPVSESQNNSEKVFLYASVEKTKAVVDHDETGAQKGTVTFEAGDKMSVWFQTGTETTGEGEEMTETPVGKVVEFTYESEDAAGLKFSADASLIPEEFTLAKAAYPAGSLNSKGVFSLIRDYTYDPDSMPIYVRADEVVKNENGTLSADLAHNASVFKFTLGDIPAYAAGFVLESQKYERDSENEPIQDKPSGAPIKITTTFPYKTGYSEDITLYSVSAHSSYLTRVYLIDGDGDEIEGSERKFKQSWNDVSKNDFIIMPRIDFNKAELRKDFVKVCGVKWAKGNLVCDTQNLYDKQEDEGFQEGWGLHDAQWKYVKWDVAGNYKYDNTNLFDLFTYGGIGRQASYASGRLVPVKSEYDIQAKVFWGYVNTDINKCNPANLTLLEGDATFSSEKAANGNSQYTLDGKTKAIAGDVAFWASKGKYCLPKKAVIQNLAHPTTSKASFQYGKYMAGDVAIYGYLFTTPQGDVVRNNEEVTFTDADLESGLFLPFVGRRGPTSNSDVIGRGTCALYRCSTLGAVENASYSEQHSQCARVIWFDGSNMPVYGFTSGKTGFTTTDYSSNCTLSVAAGGCIRPILYEE